MLDLQRLIFLPLIDVSASEYQDSKSSETAFIVPKS